jgi:hypothetical protein
MSFGKNDITGAVSGISNINVWDAQGRLKVIGGGTPPPPAPVVWGTITGLVTNQTDLINYLGLNFYPLSSNPAGYLTQTAADLLYYPLTSNPAGYITAAALIGYVPTTRTLTINGTSYDLSADRSWTIPAGGTVTSVELAAGTGISLSGTNPITTSGTITVTNDAPDQVVSLSTTGTGLSVTGTYPSFTLENTLPDQTVVLTEGTGIDITGTYPSFTITNDAPDQTVSLATTGTGLSVTGTYPSFTLENTLPDQTVVLNSGTGINVTGTYPTFTIDATGGGSGGGGGGRSYYLNGSVVQGTFAGITDMREMSPVPIIGVGTDFTISSNGYIKSFITDAGDPNKAVIPAGNWNFELWFSASSGGGSPNFYVELYKYDTVALTLTLISSSSTNPEGITNGTAIDLYFTALSVPQTTLALTDRLAVRVFVDNGGGGRTITLHTQGPHLSQIITDFPSGIVSLNGLTAFAQSLAVGTAGTDFGISSSVATHTFNLPTASALNRGALSSADWTTFNDKVPSTRTLTINGTALDLSADRSWSVGTVTSVGGTGTAFGLTLTGTVTGTGNLTLGGTLAVPIANITATGTPSATTYLRGDGTWATVSTGGSSATIGTTIDGSGGTITVGQKGYVQVPYACTITAWRLIANTAGSIVVDIWKTAAPTIPTVANVITASAKPTLSSQQTATSSTLTGWTTSVAADDIIGFNVNSATTVSWVILQIFVTKI